MWHRLTCGYHNLIHTQYRTLEALPVVAFPSESVRGGGESTLNRALDRNWSNPGIHRTSLEGSRELESLLCQVPRSLCVDIVRDGPGSGRVMIFKFAH